MAKYRSISVDVDIDIDDFEDDELIAEIIDRHLVDAVLKRVGRVVDKPTQPREHAEDALSHMMCRRPSAALHAIDRAIAAFVPVELIAARDGEVVADLYDARGIRDTICLPRQRVAVAAAVMKRGFRPRGTRPAPRATAICHIDGSIEPRPNADGAHFRDPLGTTIAEGDQAPTAPGAGAPDASAASHQA